MLIHMSRVEQWTRIMLEMKVLVVFPGIKPSAVLGLCYIIYFYAAITIIITIILKHKKTVSVLCKNKH